MALTKRVTSAFLFPTGNLAVFDCTGAQIPELQGTYSIELHKRITLEATDMCEFHGFHMLPKGFIDTAYDWAEHWIEKNMSWDEIQSI